VCWNDHYEASSAGIAFSDGLAHRWTSGMCTTWPQLWRRDEQALLENTERVPDTASPLRCRPTDTTRPRILPGPSPARLDSQGTALRKTRAETPFLRWEYWRRYCQSSPECRTRTALDRVPLADRQRPR